MSLENKIIPFSKLKIWRDFFSTSRKIIATNGVYDILTYSHVKYLEESRKLGNILIVGITSTENIKKLKGPNRPINGEIERASVLAALESVTVVCIFDELDSREFIKLARPDIYTKGGDYTIDTINQDERKLLDSMGTEIKIIPYIKGNSTTDILEKIKKI